MAEKPETTPAAVSSSVSLVRSNLCVVYVSRYRGCRFGVTVTIYAFRRLCPHRHKFVDSIKTLKRTDRCCWPQTRPSSRNGFISRYEQVQAPSSSSSFSRASHPPLHCEQSDFDHSNLRVGDVFRVVEVLSLTFRSQPTFLCPRDLKRYK